MSPKQYRNALNFRVGDYISKIDDWSNHFTQSLAINVQTCNKLDHR